MIEIKNTTKKALSMINSYKYYLSKNNGVSLYEIYNDFSDAKYRGFLYCLKLKEMKEGYNPCFCGHNCMAFTYAFLFIKNNETYLAYITKDNDYMIKYIDD